MRDSCCRLEHPLGELTQDSFYHDLVETKISDYPTRNPGCASCEYLPECCGGCCHRQGRPLEIVIKNPDKQGSEHT